MNKLALAASILQRDQFVMTANDHLSTAPFAVDHYSKFSTRGLHPAKSGSLAGTTEDRMDSASASILGYFSTGLDNIEYVNCPCDLGRRLSTLTKVMVCSKCCARAAAKP
jgi:hypothetical protein